MDIPWLLGVAWSIEHYPSLIDLRTYDINTEVDIEQSCNLINTRMGKADVRAISKELDMDPECHHLAACVGSGSVAAALDATKELPDHHIVTSKGQRTGLMHESANGGQHRARG